VYLPRIEALYHKYGNRFLDKVLTHAEKVFCITPVSLKVKVSRIAGRIAVKEALVKALGIGVSTFGNFQGTMWTEVEVLREERQAPRIRLHGKALQRAMDSGIENWLISITHDGDYAMAMVLGLKHPHSALPEEPSET
jgi:holo-[acyl-carrier protein] synthase